MAPHLMKSRWSVACQGDPLSPLLFLLVAEALQVTILEACEKGVYNGVSLAYSGTNISLLQYADDALFFGESSTLNAYNLINILKCFKKASRLKVIIAKSKLYGIGVSRADIDMVAPSLSCDHGSLPFVYLRLPVGRKMNKVVSWNEMVIVLEKGLRLGKPKLSRSGEQIFLGFQRFLAWNFMGNALWRTVITEFYCPDGGFGTYTSGAIGGVWVDMLKAVKHIEDVDSSFNVSFSLKIDYMLSSLLKIAKSMTNGIVWMEFGAAIGLGVVLLVIRLGLIDSLGLARHQVSSKLKPSQRRYKPYRLTTSPLASTITGTLGFRENSTSCPFCETELEDIERSLIRLPYVAKGVFQCSLWAIWKWRNKLVNSQSDDSTIIKDDDIFPSIQCLSKTWILARIPLKTVN
ncbi:reverse transcriptase domain, reverse transcriptase zinc-binding domain protein [Tanacetum coccineum]